MSSSRSAGYMPCDESVVGADSYFNRHVSESESFRTLSSCHAVSGRVSYGTNMSPPSFRLRMDFLVRDLLVSSIFRHADLDTNVLAWHADGSHGVPQVPEQGGGCWNIGIKRQHEPKGRKVKGRPTGACRSAREASENSTNARLPYVSGVALEKV